MLPAGYHLKVGSGKDRPTLIKFMYLTYQEIFPERQDFSHLAKTVESYFTSDTPLWWVESTLEEQKPSFLNPVAVCWTGNAIDQVTGDRYTHIFLLYVAPAHRRRGIAKALLEQTQNWAKARGDRQMGLQVFARNQPALNLYQSMGYQTQSLLMLKSL